MKRSIDLFSSKILQMGGLAMLLSAGCGTTDTGGGGGTVTQGHPAALTGKVDPAVQGSAGGSINVTASRINDDGSLSLVSSTAAKVGADGRYTLDLAANAAGSSNANLNGAAQIVVTATASGGSVVGKSAVEGSFKDGVTTTVSPITANATAEANVLIAAKASGQWSAEYSLGELRAMLSDSVVASIAANASDSASASAKAAAQASIAAMAAWQSALTAQGMSKGSIDGALSATLSAEATLDTQLDAAASADQINAAASAHFNAMLKAFSDAGASSQQIAAAATASANLMVAFSGSITADAQAQAMARANLIESTLVTAAINAQFQVMGAAQGAQSAIAAAGVTLQGQITAAASAGAQAEAQIQQAWAQYSAAINVQLSSMAPVTDQLFASLNAAITNDLKALTTARANLSGQSSISAAASVEAQALVQFTASAMAHKDLLLGAGSSDAEASAWLTAAVDLQAAATFTGK